MAKRKERKRS